MSISISKVELHYCNPGPEIVEGYFRITGQGFPQSPDFTLKANPAQDKVTFDPAKQADDVKLDYNYPGEITQSFQVLNIQHLVAYELPKSASHGGHILFT